MVPRNSSLAGGGSMPPLLTPPTTKAPHFCRDARQNLGRRQKKKEKRLRNTTGMHLLSLSEAPRLKSFVPRYLQEPKRSAPWEKRKSDRIGNPGAYRCDTINVQNNGVPAIRHALQGHALLGSSSVPLTLLKPQSRLGDKTTWNLSVLSPKRDCGSKRDKKRSILLTIPILSATNDAGAHESTTFSSPSRSASDARVAALSAPSIKRRRTRCDKNISLSRLPTRPPPHLRASRIQLTL